MENELQLLVIDAGECCFLKVEKGRFETMLFDDDIGGLGFRIISHPFTKLREALEQKPVPRIERAESRYVDGALIIQSGGGEFQHYLSPEVFDALSQLVGKPLPVWEGGKWTRLPKTSEYIGDPLDGTGVTIWRFTR